MAKKKISGLPAGSALNGTELVPIVQAGTTKRTTTQDIADLGNASSVSGSGTINYLAKFTASSTLGNSIVQDNGSRILINTGTANQNTTINASQIGMSRTSDGAEVVYFSKNTDLGANGTANINGYDGIQFRTQGAESVKATITETGNLGLGTTTPGAPLSFADTNVLKIQFNGNSANYYGISKLAGGGNLQDGNLQFIAGNTYAGGFTFTSEGVEKMRIAASGNVLIGTTTDVASSKLTIDSTTQGVLVPRMTTTQINAIGSPANGLIAYNTTLAVLCFYDGSGWKKVSHSAM